MSAEGKKRPDVWLLLLILVLTVAVGGGLWLFASAADIRIETAVSQMKSQSDRVWSQNAQILSQISQLRKEVRSLTLSDKAAARATPPAAEKAGN